MTTTDHAEQTPRRPRPWVGWAVFALALCATFVLGLLAASVLERRRESAALLPAAPVADLEGDSAKWGESFPRQYESWRRTAEDGPRTKHGGPGHYDHLAADPRLKALFAGYPFEVEYNDERGHMHALEDVRGTARMDPARGGKPQPGTCLTCKSSDVPGLMAEMGVAEFYKATFGEVSAKVSHPIGCADCHDPQTMNLRITRPALREAFASMGKDINTASHQEMRTLVCAQCHAEYYFAKKNPSEEKGTYLTFPWKRGTTADAMETYYTRDVPHTDWTHPVSGAAMVKMQHPDYEAYRSGVHAYRDVSCADCHMPYRSEGGVKFTDHHIQSPLKNINAACGTCHRWSEAEIRARVETIQDTTRELLDRAEDALVAAHNEVGAAAKAGVTAAQLAESRDLLRRAQLRWDYIAAGNGMGFHAPQESARVLASAIDLAQQARVSVAKARK
ncbi:MAG TPA: ammonia-forming cytochrome c nitrite reductase subunit c552 [Armatimonadota bacterium]|nr:ammonia-forming cytochrome c nitrite reductase subunit c552 [Armatimonadota bacterium]HOS43866.1 ammonia-forming cytochrome c nitrite reductase subunit c552 [Armatimonadota bacterium]